MLLPLVGRTLAQQIAGVGKHCIRAAMLCGQSQMLFLVFFISFSPKTMGIWVALVNSLLEHQRCGIRVSESSIARHIDQAA